jgi:hypothetical protein
MDAIIEWVWDHDWITGLVLPIVAIVIVAVIGLTFVNKMALQQQRTECAQLIELNGPSQVQWQNNTCFVKYEGKWLPTDYFKQKTSYVPIPVIIPVR